MDVLRSLPEDISHMCQLLFDLPLLFSVRLSTFDRFWPLIDNVYSVRKTTPVISKSGDYEQLAVICQFKQAYHVALSSSQGLRSGSTKRASSSYDIEFKIVKYTNHMEFHPTGSSVNYSHSLDESNASKRNSLLQGLVQLDIAKGYCPTAIINLIRGYNQSEIEGRLKAAGGAYLKGYD